jgi:hypothetical protein
MVTMHLALILKRKQIYLNQCSNNQHFLRNNWLINFIPIQLDNLWTIRCRLFNYFYRFITMNYFLWIVELFDWVQSLFSSHLMMIIWATIETRCGSSSKFFKKFDFCWVSSLKFATTDPHPQNNRRSSNRRFWYWSEWILIDLVFSIRKKYCLCCCVALFIIFIDYWIGPWTNGRLECHCSYQYAFSIMSICEICQKLFKDVQNMDWTIYPIGIHQKNTLVNPSHGSFPKFPWHGLGWLQPAPSRALVCSTISFWVWIDKFDMQSKVDG